MLLWMTAALALECAPGEVTCERANVLRDALNTAWGGPAIADDHPVARRRTVKIRSKLERILASGSGCSVDGDLVVTFQAGGFDGTVSFEGGAAGPASGTYGQGLFEGVHAADPGGTLGDWGVFTGSRMGGLFDGSGYLMGGYVRVAGRRGVAWALHGSCPTPVETTFGSYLPEGLDYGTCGNDVLESGEVCDGAAAGGPTCTDLGYQSGTIGCADDCLVDVSTCVGCDHAACEEGGPMSACTDQQCVADVCAADPYCCDFAWDGLCVGAVGFVCGLQCGTCTHSVCSEGPSNTPLDATCDPCTEEICAIDPYCCNNDWDDVCVEEVGFVCNQVCGTCGDDVRMRDESCDGLDLAGQTCAGLGFSGGALSCADDCTFDTSGCTD